MPGAYCSLFGCGISRRNTGVGIFRLFSGKESKQARNELIKVITRDHVVDANFRKIIEARNVYVGEKHFKKEEIECREYYIF